MKGNPRFVLDRFGSLVAGHRVWPRGGAPGVVTAKAAAAHPTRRVIGVAGHDRHLMWMWMWVWVWMWVCMCMWMWMWMLMLMLKLVLLLLLAVDVDVLGDHSFLTRDEHVIAEALDNVAHEMLAQREFARQEPQRHHVMGQRHHVMVELEMDHIIQSSI